MCFRMLSSLGDSDVDCTFKHAKKTILLIAHQKNIWTINYILKTSGYFFYNVSSKEQNVEAYLIS